MPVDAPLYPVSLILQGRRVLVVGTGGVADAKAAQLEASGAVVDRVSAEDYDGASIGTYRLVFSAAGAEVNRRVYADAEAADVWVNSADDPANCSFLLPAVARRGPITAAVSTGGQSPALATWLRRQLEAELGPEYEVLAELLADERAALRAAGRSTEGLDWQSALDSGMLELIRAGQVQQARERLQACLSSS